MIFLSSNSISIKFDEQINLELKNVYIIILIVSGDLEYRHL